MSISSKYKMLLFGIVRCHYIRRDITYDCCCEGIPELGESSFLEVEMPTTGSLPTDEEGILQTQQLDQLWNASHSG